MPYCPTHGPKTGIYCDECGARLLPDPPAGDTISLRSPEAHASAQVNQHFHLSDAARPTLVKCPKCGRYNPKENTFDCMGECGRQNLCLRHFDEEYEVCVDCARKLRGEDKKRAAAQREQEEALTQWRARAETAEASLLILQKEGKTLRLEVQQRVAELEKARHSIRKLEKQLDESKAQLRQATAEARQWQQQHDDQADQLARAQKEAKEARQRIQRLEKQLVDWRSRAEKAEAFVAEVKRKEEEAKKRPIWQQIGIELIKIPAGEFLYGDDKKPVYLPDYYLAKTPVTNLQYKAFVDATGHEPPKHWKNGKIPKGKENHPVVYVSWYDAQAFCEWAGLRLPTEQEWEKGARGTDGRRFPWGDHSPNPNLCNFNSYIKDTTPVDRYPDGASPYGLLDMAGNIWEWCENWYDNGNYTGMQLVVE